MSRRRRTNGFIVLYKAVIMASFPVLITALPPRSAHAYDFQGCIACHKTTLEEGNSRLHLHSPFKQHKCAQCHAVPVGKDSSVVEKDRRAIDWLAESDRIDTSHGFLLPGDKLGDTLIVELHGAGGEFSRHDIAVPPRAEMAEEKDCGKPPAISDVRVLNAQRGVLLSATIGWRTESLSFSRVRCGEKSFRNGQRQASVLAENMRSP